MRLTLAALSLSAIAAMNGPASAETLTLDCRVHSSEPGHQASGVRRMEIDLSAKTVSVSDNTGKGFKVQGSHPIVSADKDRIVLDAADGKTSSIDRHTGMYTFHSTPKKLTIEGRCVKTSRTL